MDRDTPDLHLEGPPATASASDRPRLVPVIPPEELRHVLSGARSDEQSIGAGLITVSFAGEAGSYSDLVKGGSVGGGLTPHHIPQAAQGFTSRAEGGAIAMTHEDHTLARSSGSAGRPNRAAESDLPFREVFEKDPQDYLDIVGEKGQAHAENLRQYYRDTFPDLYGVD